MRGIQKIYVNLNNMEYNIVLYRNITIIRGDSGTGKTTFYNLLRRYRQEGAKTRVKLKSTAPVIPVTDDIEQAVTVIKANTNSILIFDEDTALFNKREFVDAVTNSSNYFVFITRKTLFSIPYSINEIYEMTTCSVGNVSVHTLNRIYRDLYNRGCDSVITEDSSSGRELLSRLFNIEDTMGGNGSIRAEALRVAKYSKPLAIVDGAAFGPFIDDLYRDFISAGKGSLWAPESFEYLLLLSKIVWRQDVGVILENPSDQISSELFLTWERFFTWLVTDIMESHPGRYYSKHKLPDWYFDIQNIRKLIDALPDELKGHVK